MIAVVWIAVAAFVVLADGWAQRRCGPMPDDEARQVIVALHSIRRRLQVSQFKLEIRQEAAARRRQLRDELRDLDRQEREL